MTRNISVGQTVAASFNTPTLFIIAKDITRMQVQAAVSEADIGDVLVNQRVTFTVDAYPDITFTGRVNQIRLEPAVSANVVTYSTIITAPNDDLKLRPGMTANIFIYTKEVDSALLIPAKALNFRPDSSLSKQFVILSSPDENGGQHSGRHSGATSSSASAVTPPRDHSKDTAGQELDTTSKKAQKAFVWLKVGDSLIEKRIRIGLNDETHVEVLKGLSLDDEVATGIEIPVKGSAATPAARSPFMPARRGGGNTRPAGGAGGTGGGAARPAGGGTPR